MQGDGAEGTAQVSVPQAQLLAAIVDSSFDAIVSKTLDGTITSWNPAAERIFGYSASEAIGQSIAMLLPAERLPEEEIILARLRRGERIENLETVRVRKDGRRVEVAVTSSPVRDGSGRIVGASKIVRDTTERNATVRALARSESRLAGIVESAMDAIITVDDTGRVLVFNDAAASMFGWTAQQMTGQSLDRLIPARFASGHLTAITRFGEGAASRRSMGRAGEIAGVRADGSEFPVEASISHVEVDGHQLFTVIMRDLSAVRQARAERQGLEAQLREAQKMEAIGTLAGGIAHDFNNIMGSIIGNVGLAKTDLKPDDAARLSIDQIDRAATRARSLVRQILAFSRRQPQQLHNQPLRPLIEEVIGLLRSTLPMVVRLDGRLADRPVHALVDSTQLHQVLVNLCTNAWHALRGSTGRIELGLEEIALDTGDAVRIGDLTGGAHAHIWVSDDGCGMDHATKARIFEPFFTTKPVGEGTGLGLSVVHGIVSAHRGAITVDTAPGKGSIFHVYLPALALDATAGVDAPQASPPASASGQRVAYVDDDEVMNLMVGRLLERSGFRVTCYQTAHAALAAIESGPEDCDIVVTDFNMPECTGIELAVAVAAIRAELPVIISSGYIGDDLRAAAEHINVRALLAKENTFEDLSQLILSVLDPS